jgi:hypothetical protein
LLIGIGVVSSITAQAQWPRDPDYRRDRDDRDYRRGGGDVYRRAQDNGFRDGVYTGEKDAQQRESYNPERSHYYRNATYGYDNYGSRNEYRRAYRDGFVRGYSDGYRRYGRRRYRY